MGVKGIKGFQKGMVCKGNVGNGDYLKQYAENTDFQEDVVPKLCKKGMHLTENPLDVFSYYKPGESEYAEVEALGDIDKGNIDSKISTNKLRIGLKIGIEGVIKAGVKFIFEKTASGNTTVTTGVCAHAATTGYGANAVTTGVCAHAATTGEGANAATTGKYANAATTGHGANAATTGHGANAATTGHGANAATTGYGANAATTGYGANAEAKGKNSIAAAIGINSMAKAALNNWIVLSEWHQDNKYNWCIKEVKTAIVDGKKIKADTWYKLEKGEFVEVNE
jgi:hypothetical protein